MNDHKGMVEDEYNRAMDEICCQQPTNESRQYTSCKLLWIQSDSVVAACTTKYHFQKFQSRFEFVEGNPLCIVQPLGQTKSTHRYDSIMSISDVHATADMTKSAF